MITVQVLVDTLECGSEPTPRYGLPPSTFYALRLGQPRSGAVSANPNLTLFCKQLQRVAASCSQLHFLKKYSDPGARLVPSRSALLTGPAPERDLLCSAVEQFHLDSPRQSENRVAYT